MKCIDEVNIQNKTVLLRVDFNVSINSRHQIANDERIKQSLPTINYLLANNNKLILLSHLGRPKGRDQALSLSPVAKALQAYLPERKVSLIKDFTSPEIEILRNSDASQIFMLENIRFYEGEDTNDPEFTKQLASLGEIYVNDAFGVAHRKSASVVGLASLLPSYGGLLLKKEVLAIKNAIENPQKPLVSILGGAKASTKIKLIEKLLTLSDFVLLGGGIANTFLAALGEPMGKSLYEEESIPEAKRLLHLADARHTRLLLPSDVVVGDHEGKNVKEEIVHLVKPTEAIFDIGPQTRKEYIEAIKQARTIIWNGPVGFFEKEAYRGGTDAIFEAITENSQAVSLVGGGETIAALNNKEHLEKITHLSTGGGAMLEFIENGTLAGIEALH